jgi:chromosome segregation ATPase
MTKQEETLRKIKELSSKGLNDITRKEFDIKKKEAEILELEAKIDDFESKGFDVEVDLTMLEKLHEDLSDIDFEPNDILQEQITMDELARYVGRVNGVEIFSFGEAKENNTNLIANKDDLLKKNKKLEGRIKKVKEEEKKDKFRLDIIKNESFISRIDMLISKYENEYKDFIEADVLLDKDIDKVKDKIKTIEVKIKEQKEELDGIYLKLADEKKEEDKNYDEDIEKLKTSLTELNDELPQHQLEYEELSFEKTWLATQINLNEKDFMGVDAKLKIWTSKKNDLSAIITEMEKRHNITPAKRKKVEHENPLKGLLERSRVLADTMLNSIKEKEMQEENFVEEEEEVTFKNKSKISFNPFVFSMLAVGGYFALKK